MKYTKFQQLIIMILIPELVGILSSLLAGNSASIYSELVQPPLAPPSWLFGIVWPILYAFMGIASYIVLIQDVREKQKKKAFDLYAIQLMINFLWSIVFFRYKMIWSASVIIILLDIFIMLTIISFYGISKKSGYLLIPYLFWVTYALYLNIGIGLLN